MFSIDQTVGVAQLYENYVCNSTYKSYDKSMKLHFFVIISYRIMDLFRFNSLNFIKSGIMVFKVHFM